MAKFYYVKPAQGYITSLFSNARKNPVLGVIRPHQGIDISSAVDNSIIAAADGTVRVADNVGKTGFGKYVVITHGNGQETVYAHLSAITVRTGQRVKQGAKIGVKGTTGNSTGIHLHFEISRGRWTNDFSNKIDPLTQFACPVTRETQVFLNRLGYGPLAEDGVYGDATITAVTRYQRAKRLPADGVAGRTTRTALEADVNAMPAPQNTTEVGDLRFTSPTLKRDFETFLGSKAQQEIVVKAAVAQGYQADWLTKQSADGDKVMLAIGAILRTNK